MAEAHADAQESMVESAALRDPLNRWALIFLAVGIGLTIILMILFAVMAADVPTIRDQLLINQDQWVILVTVLLIASIIGLIFVIVGRVGGTQGGSYLSADLDAEERARNVAAAEMLDEEEEESIAAGDPIETRNKLLRPARIVDPFGPDGKILLAYDVPGEGGPGVYGDVLIRVDSDATLNVRTRMAKLKPKA